MSTGSDRDLRLACIKIAIEIHTPVSGYSSRLTAEPSYLERLNEKAIISTADNLYKFVSTGVMPIQ